MTARYSVVREWVAESEMKPVRLSGGNDAAIGEGVLSSAEPCSWPKRSCAESACGTEGASV